MVNYIGDRIQRGSAVANVVDVTVNLPSANLKLGTVTPEEGTSWDGNTGKWVIPTLKTGEKITLKLEAIVTAVQPGDTVTGGASVVQVDGTPLATPITASAAFTGENAAVNLVAHQDGRTASARSPARSCATRW